MKEPEHELPTPQFIMHDVIVATDLVDISPQ